MHSHSDYVLLEDGDAQSKIRQGVTTAVIGESTSAVNDVRNDGPELVEPAPDETLVSEEVLLAPGLFD